MDDGTLWRMAEDRWLLTSSTGGAARMARHLSYVADVLLAGARVAVVNQSEHWAGLAFAGPRTADLLGDLTDEAVPAHMGHAPATIAGIAVRVLAASCSGERSFEVHIPAHQAHDAFTALVAAAQGVGGGVYGLDAMDHLRVEKGHVVIGAEADGRAIPADLGMGGMLRKAGGFVGWQALSRPALADPAGRQRLVGVTSMEGAPIPEGAMLVTRVGEEPLGHVTPAARGGRRRDRARPADRWGFAPWAGVVGLVPDAQADRAGADRRADVLRCRRGALS